MKTTYFTHRTTFFLAISLLLTGIVSSALGQETAAPLVDRSLSGSVDLGNVGRFVGIPQLGTLTVSSNELVTGETARNVTISANGFAWTPSGLLLRNGSGSDLVFDGSSEQSQSHNLEVYYFGTGVPVSASSSVGAFSIEDFSPDSNNINRVVNGDNAAASYGGFWNQSTVFGDGAGNEQTLSTQGAENPFSPDGEIGTGFTGSGGFFTLNRTDSPQPALFDSVIRPIFSAPLFAVDEESVPLQRADSLFQVEPTPSDEVAQLDLSGIEINVSGQSLQNREISGRVIQLGRFIRDDSTLTIERDDTVRLTTSGSDEANTRLQLNAFNLERDGQVSAVLENDVVFDSASSSATVSLAGEFEIDRNQTGTVIESFDVGGNIASLENITGETVQSRLSVGYRYSVVDNNELISDDITVFKIGDFDTTGEAIDATNVSEAFSTSTHTNLTIDSEFTLDNSPVQIVTLSEGNGIIGEGLAGEEVIAETTFEVRTVEIASSQLVATEGDVGEGDPITIANARTATGLDATAFVVSANREGSDLWFFPVEGGGSTSIAAGESLTLTPTFDETGLDATVEEGSLGRNFRTQFTVGFQDGSDVGLDDVAQGTDANASFRFQGFDRFDFLGSEETRQDFTFVVERAIEAEATAGQLALAAGTSLRDVGVNLTNTSGNTTEGFGQTTVAILDGVVGDPEGIDLDIAFASLEEASMAESEAFGFDTLSSDIARIEGLDGVQHTLQLDFNLDEDSILADASLLWFDEGDVDDLEDDAWVNAILGNSDIDSFDLENDLLTLFGAEEAIGLSDFLDSRRFELSYTDYLLSLDEGEEAALGAFGFDEVNGVVWAVIDHNSSFASTATAVPEPTSIVLSLLGLAAVSLKRRRVA